MTRVDHGVVATISSPEQYERALKVASGFFNEEPEPGTPEGDEFLALIARIEAYEASLADLASHERG